jgi:hypothetical protein
MSSLLPISIWISTYLLQHRIENCPEDIDLIFALKFIKSRVNGKKLATLFLKKLPDPDPKELFTDPQLWLAILANSNKF